MVEENQLGSFFKKHSLRIKGCSLRTKERCLVEKVPWQTYSPDPELPPLSATASPS